MRFTAVSALAVTMFLLGTATGADLVKATLQYGKYTGSCVQLAASSVNGSSSYCVAKGSVVTYTFTATWTKVTKPTIQSMYQYDQDGVRITTLSGKTWDYAAYSSKPGTVTFNSTVPKSKAFCMSVKFDDGSAATFRAYTIKQGRTWTYVEEGMYNTATNTAVEETCPTLDNPKLYCTAATYNYRCVAYAL